MGGGGGGGGARGLFKDHYACKAQHSRGFWGHAPLEIRNLVALRLNLELFQPK